MQRSQMYQNEVKYCLHPASIYKKETGISILEPTEWHLQLNLQYDQGLFQAEIGIRRLLGNVRLQADFFWVSIKIEFINDPVAYKTYIRNSEGRLLRRKLFISNYLTSYDPVGKKFPVLHHFYLLVLAIINYCL